MSRRVTIFLILLGVSLAAASGPPQPSPAWQKAFDGGKASELAEAFAGELESGHPDALGAWALAQARLARGERALAVVAAVEGLRADPGHPAAFLLESLITDQAFFDASTTRLVADSLPGLLSEPRLEPAVRFNLRWLAYRIAARQGDPVARASAYRAAGFPDRGLFAVVPSLTARLDYLADANAKGEARKDLHWDASRWDLPMVRPPLYAYPDDREASFWAALPFEVDGAVDALLYSNAATSLRIFVDGQKAVEQDFFGRQESPTRMVGIHLAKGRHLLLVQVFASSAGDGVHLALLDTQGNALGVHWQDDPSGLSWRGASNVIGEAGFRFLRDFPASDPRQPALEALFDGWLGDSARYRLAMEKVAKDQPKCLLWRLLVAEAYLFRADDLPTPVAQGRAESAVEAVGALDTECALARFYKALVRQAANDSDEDLPVLQSLLESSPRDPRWGLRLAARYQQKGWVTEARGVLQRVRDEHPDCEEVESAWIGFAGAVGDRAAQLQAIDRLSRLRFVGPEKEEYLRATLQRGETRKLLEEEAALYGDRDLQFERKLAQLDAKARDFQAAEADFKAILERAPDDEDATFGLARVYDLEGRAAEAQAIREKIKRERPRLFQVDMAHWLRGEALPFEDRQVTREQVLAEDHTEGPDQAPSSFLLDQQFTRVQEDGSSLERYHGIIRVNDKEGVDREGEQSLRGQILLSVHTVKPDGRILEPERIPEKSSLSMPGLEPGDLIEYETLTFLPPNLVRDRSYITTQVFLFQDLEKPFHRTQWYLEYPKTMPFQIFEQNLPHPAESGENGGREYHNWEFRSMPRIPPEPDTPYKTAFVPLAEAVGRVGWGDVATFLRNRMVGAFRISPEVEAACGKALEGVRDRDGRAEAIVQYLLKEVDGEDGGQWDDPTEILLSRRGSRIPVACAMLDQAGIPYRLLLAEPVVNRVERQDLPRLGQFTVPVVEVGGPGKAKSYYVLESPYRASRVLPWYLQGARALPVTGPGPWKPMLLPTDVSLWTAASEEESRTLGTDGSMDVRHTQRMDPDASESLRGTLQRLPQDRHEQVIQMALSRQYGNAKVEGFNFRNLDNAERPLEWDYRLHVEGYATVSGDRMTVSEPIPPLQLSKALASLPQRSLPLSTGGFIYLHQRYTLALPSGAATDFRPPEISLTGPFGSYRLQGTLKDGVLTFERSLAIPYQIVEPARYPAFREFLAKIDAAEAGQLVLQLPGETAH